MSEILPALFIGHGNPLNALQQNSFTEGWSRIGQQIARPKAILAISAHWFVPGTGVTISTSPRTIHDFGGFPANCTKSSIWPPAIRHWHDESSNCSHLCRSIWTIPGGWITVLGRCLRMSIPLQIFRSCNSASTRRRVRCFTSKSAESLPHCEQKAY